MIRSLLLFLAGALFYLVLRLCGVDVSYAQLSAFPFLVAALWFFSYRKLSPPKGILAACTVLAFLGVGFSKGYKAEDARGFIVSALPGDEYEAIARSLRTKFNAYLQMHGDVRAVRYPDVIKSSTGAASVLNDSLSMATVWGTPRWINVSIPPQPPARVGELMDHELTVAFPSQFLDLQIVNSVPTFGLSREPEDATVQFLAEFFLGLSGDTPELRYARSSQIVGRWINSAHRAAPLLLEGDLNIVSGIKSLQVPELNCAISRYERGLSYINTPSENPALYAALLNNLAVAKFLKGSLLGEKNIKHAPSKLLRAAMHTKMPPNAFNPDFEPWKVASSNVKALKKLGRSAKRARLGIKKRHHRRHKGAKGRHKKHQSLPN